MVNDFQIESVKSIQSYNTSMNYARRLFVACKSCVKNFVGFRFCMKENWSKEACEVIGSENIFGY